MKDKGDLQNFLEVLSDRRDGQGESEFREGETVNKL